MGWYTSASADGSETGLGRDGGRLQQELDDAAGMHRWQAAADAAGHSQLQASGAGVQQAQAWVLGSGCSGQPC